MKVLLDYCDFLMASSKEKAIKAGFTKYLTKPIDPNRIDTEITQFLTTEPPS